VAKTERWRQKKEKKRGGSSAALKGKNKTTNNTRYKPEKDKVGGEDGAIQLPGAAGKTLPKRMEKTGKPCRKPRSA